jgi:hypothetical protein
MKEHKSERKVLVRAPVFLAQNVIVANIAQLQVSGPMIA